MLVKLGFRHHVRTAREEPVNWEAPPYALLDPPFQGGYARVYKATHPDRADTFYAVKFQLDPTSKEQLKRLRREAEVLGSIEHPHVLKLVESRLDAQLPFIVLEYMNNGSLADYIRQRALDFNGTVLLLRQISSALGVFHSRSGFHRDVKPDNVLIAPDGAFVLADANLAGLPKQSSEFTRSVAGTPGYIDPFVVNNPYDSAADIWSLAVTVLECATGVLPNTEQLQRGLVSLDTLKAPSVAHRTALERLLKSMLNSSRATRPSAVVVHKYADVLLRGGKLPVLVGPPTPPAPSAQPDLASALVGFGVVALVFVGIAALMDGGQVAPPAPPNKPRP